MIWAVALSFESELPRWCELLTRFTILHICNDPHEHFVFHKESILRLFKSNKELKCTELSAPSMSAARALELKVATLFSLQHEKLIAVPLPFVFDGKHLCERFLTGPFNLDPLNRCSIHSHRNILMPIYIVFNLLDISLGRRHLNALAVQGWLEPIGHLENIPCFQILIISVALVVRINSSLGFPVFPLEDLFVRHKRWLA